MSINLFELMNIFVQLAECGSFTKTAELLHLHRPAVTKGIQQLEAHLNTRLLQRTTRQIHLTPEGEAFYQRCKLLLAEVDHTLQNFSPNRPLAGILRVDMPTSLAKYLIIPSLKDFYRQYPQLKIVISSNDSQIDLVKEGVDCTLRLGELIDSDYIARKVGNLKMLTCASPAYLAKFGIPHTLEDLKTHQGVAFSLPNRRFLDWDFQTPQGKTTLPIPNWQLAITRAEDYVCAAVEGLGMIQAMEIYVEDKLADGRLIALLPHFPVPDKPLSLLYPSRLHLAQKVKVFGDWITSLLQNK
ncbi:LysR family transcriptional regulator [Rodentibacter trehalosifermentans]|uniref:LysR family transcriptional regulator n=1 Tax=Rodentibacter trehalosifermentans TaxID=1908263 RepID=A0A1V3J2Q5_9PAST|nr:LysR family transcriptional regulator [Rodentibacter trehalosifermentans]OOF47609.1 LysR family transcriptional regulator [Rodentibacter trehalosifermentans]OOF49041.1 LysR family transcriptional regulator [Rodentibacter trehalosifermentans]